MNKSSKSPVSAADYAITLYIDSSYPLTLTLQLFWFGPEIGKFLERELFFEASNGIRFGSLMDFTYTPLKMEPTKRSPYVGYLLGFGSNMHKECFNKSTVRFESEEEKLRHKDLIINAVNELVQAATSITSNSSPWFIWNVDKN